jgi:hypothetical protein
MVKKTEPMHMLSLSNSMPDYIIGGFRKGQNFLWTTIPLVVWCLWLFLGSGKNAFWNIWIEVCSKKNVTYDSYGSAEPQKVMETKNISKTKVTTAAVILHDIGTKQDRKDQVEAFKDGHIDFCLSIICCRFWCATPKETMYIGRAGLKRTLTNLTCVNRTYKNFFRYGYWSGARKTHKDTDNFLSRYEPG